MTERTDQFDERDQLEGIEPPIDDNADTGDAHTEQRPDALGSPEGGQPV